MAEKQNKQKRILEGVIVSNKMLKTVVVAVKRLKFNSKYQKAYWVTKKFKAHAENPHEVGEKVKIEATRPLSKDKRWRVIEKK